MRLDTGTRRLLQRRRHAAERFPPAELLLRGTLGRRYVRCGKPGCHCQKGRGHGPVWYVTVSLGVGRTRQVTVVAEDLGVAREYIGNYLRLWRCLEQVSAINLELLRRRGLIPAGAQRAGTAPERRRRGLRPKR